jgi:PAS domain S-box-containing protein
MWSEDMLQACHVTYLRDQRYECDTVEQLLSQANYITHSVRTQSALIDTVLLQQIDILLLHDGIVGIDYNSIFSILRHSRPNLPIILISSELQQTILTEYFKFGMTDYLPKSKLCQLDTTIKRAWHNSHIQQLQYSAYDRIVRVEQRFAEVFPAYSTVFAIIHADTGRILATNYNLAQLIHLPNKQPLIGCKLEQLGLYLPDQARNLGHEDIQRLITGYTYTVQYNGSVRQITLTLSAEPITIDTQACYLLIGNLPLPEIQRRELIPSERILQQQQAQERPMFITRLFDGRYVDANRAWLQLCGYERDELLIQGRSMIKLWAKPAHRSRLLKQHRSTQGEQQFEYVLQRKSGELIVGLMTV